MSAILEWGLAEAAHNLSMRGGGWRPWDSSELQPHTIKGHSVMWEAGLELLGLSHAWGTRSTKKFLSTCWGRAGLSLLLVSHSGESQLQLTALMHTGGAVRERRPQRDVQLYYQHFPLPTGSPLLFQSVGVNSQRQLMPRAPAFCMPFWSLTPRVIHQRETSSSSLYCLKTLILISWLKKPTYSVPTPTQPWKKIDIYIILVT